MIHDWNRSGAISRNAKRAATISIIAVIGISVRGVPQHVIVIQIVTLTCVLLFIWTRQIRSTQKRTKIIQLISVLYDIVNDPASVPIL